MSLNLGQFAPSNFLAPNPPLTLFSVDTRYAYIRVSNNSPYALSVNLTGIPITVPEFYIQDLEVKPWFQGNITITPSINISTVSHAQANTLVVECFYKSEVQSPISMAIQAPAVTATASGKPIFSSFFGWGATAGNNQSVNIFNPPGSGVTFTFHSARAFSNSSGIPTANLIYLAGADLNLPLSAGPVSHAGTPNPPVSFSHCTAEDTNAGHGGNAIEVLRLTGSNLQTVDLLTFPDVVTLAPGGNMRISVADTTVGHTVEIILKWSEDIAVAPAGGMLSSMFNVIQGNEIDGNPILQLVALDGGDADLSAKNGDVNLQCLQDTGNPALASRIFGRVNHFWNGTNDIFVSANPAYQWVMNRTLGTLSFRQNANAPSIGGVITWTSDIWTIGISGNMTLGNASFPGIVDVLGAGSQEIKGSFTGAEAYFRMVAQTGALSVLMGTDKIVINGSTSGTATLWQTFQGDFKYVMVQLSNFRNGGAPAQNITLPAAFTKGAFVKSTDVNTFQLLAATVAQTIGIITAIAVGGGTATNATSMGSLSLAEVLTGFDTVSFAGGAASAHNGLIIIEGQ